MPDTTRPEDGVTERYDDLMRRLREAVLGSPGVTDPSLRLAVEARAAAVGGRPGSNDGVPPELTAFVDRVARQAYMVNERDITALRQAGFSEDAIFEVTASAALGAGLSRLERGLAALEGGTAAGGER